MIAMQTIVRRVARTHPDLWGSTWITLLAITMLAGCAFAPPSPVAATPATSPEVLTFTGDASMDTATFHLSADTYRSTWTKAAGCSFFASLESPTDESLGGSLGSSLSDGPTSGETWAYNIGGPGTFYLHVFGGCRWSITLTGA